MTSEDLNEFFPEFSERGEIGTYFSDTLAQFSIFITEIHQPVLEIIE